MKNKTKKKKCQELLLYDSRVKFTNDDKHHKSSVKDFRNTIKSIPIRGS